MTDALVHRGPDSDGLWQDEHCALGHRRLAIIDLSASGAQPMAVDDGRAVIAYNGEVYNFRELRSDLEKRGAVFGSSSDTEVLLRLYLEHGERFVEQLDGMFAFALWDATAQKLLLARDRYGQKPLFWSSVGDATYFASEIKSLLTIPELARDLDLGALESFLVTNSIPAPRSMYQQIRRLEPGELMVITPAGQRTSRFWLPDRPAREQPARSEGDYVAEVGEELRAAVQRQLVADVPVGLFLSGGIDSSLILVNLARARAKFDAYTVTFAGLNSRQDELPFAQQCAERFGATHHVVQVGPDAYGDPDALIAQFDEPFADVAAPAQAELARAARRHMTVALTGDGGDELFGGYETHVVMHQRDRLGPLGRRTSWAQRCSAWIPNSPGRRNPLRALRRGLQLLGADWPDTQLLRANLTAAAQSALLRPEWLSREDPFAALRPRSRRGPHDLESYFDPLEDRVLGDLLLHKSDITAMAHGLEGRAPFLDERLVALAGRLPRSMLVRGLQGKHVLRRLVEKELGADLARRRKTGFSPPLATWLRNELRPLMQDQLGQGARVFEFVRATRVQELVDEHGSGAADHQRILWPLILLESFLRRA